MFVRRVSLDLRHSLGNKGEDKITTAVGVVCQCLAHHNACLLNFAFISLLASHASPPLLSVRGAFCINFIDLFCFLQDFLAHGTAQGKGWGALIMRSTFLRRHFWWS
jgi:hypothetical protein